MSPIAMIKDNRNNPYLGVCVQSSSQFLIAIFRGKTISGGKVEQNVRVSKVAENGIMPLVARQNFVVMPNVY